MLACEMGMKGDLVVTWIDGIFNMIYGNRNLPISVRRFRVSIVNFSSKS